MTDVGVEAASRTYFSRPVADPRPASLRAARRAAAGTDATTTRSCTRTARGSDATRCSTRCTRRATSTPTERRRAKAAGLGLDPGERYTDRSAIPYFFDYVQQQLIRRYGVRHGPRRRPGGPHDARPAPAGARAGGGRRRRRAPRRPVGRAGGDRRGDRPRARDGLVHRLRHRPVQHRRRRAPPARLGVQAVRPGDRAQAGDRPVQDLLRRLEPGDAVPVRARGRAVDRQQRRAGRGADERHPGDHRLGQRRLRAARSRRRARRTSRRRPSRSASRARSTASRPRGSAACGSASRRSRCRTPTRPSPTVASTTRRRAIDRVDVPAVRRQPEVDDLGDAAADPSPADPRWPPRRPRC